MFKVIDLSDTGKTRKLLEECSENDGVIVCAHPEKIADKCSAYNLPYVSSYYYTDYHKTGNRYVYIDELGKFINAIMPEMYQSVKDNVPEMEKMAKDMIKYFSGYTHTVQDKEVK